MKYFGTLLFIFLISCGSPSIIDYKPEKFEFKINKPFVFRKDRNLYFSKGNSDSLSKKPIYKLKRNPSYYEQNIFISPNSEYILVREKNQLVLIDNNGNLIEKIGKPKKDLYFVFEKDRYRWENIQWSKNSNFILLIKDLRKENGKIKNLISIYNIKTRTLMELTETPTIIDSYFSNNSESVYYSSFKTPNLLVVNKLDITRAKETIEIPEFSDDSIFICFSKEDMYNNSLNQKSWVVDNWKLGRPFYNLKDGVYLYHKDTLKLIMKCIPHLASSSRRPMSNHESSLSYFLAGDRYYKFKNYSKEYNGSLLIDVKTMKYQEIGKNVEFYYSITSQDISVNKQKPIRIEMRPDELKYDTIIY